MTGEEVDISEERRNRYLDKLDVLEERLDDLEGWMQDPDEELLNNKERRFAVYKAFQEAVEAVTDLCAMYLVDHQHGIGGDSENIGKCGGRLFSEELTRTLIQANGLRNRVIHDYNGFSDQIALKGIRNQTGAMNRFHAEVKGWISTG